MQTVETLGMSLTSTENNQFTQSLGRNKHEEAMKQVGEQRSQLHGLTQISWILMGRGTGDPYVALTEAESVRQDILGDHAEK